MRSTSTHPPITTMAAEATEHSPALNDSLSSPLYHLSFSVGLTVTRCSSVRTLANELAHTLVSPSTLKHCADQLSLVLTDIFSTSVETRRVLDCFKTLTIIPLPEKPRITGLNDYRPVAMISVVMKSFVHLLSHLCSIADSLLDPMQFAYRANTSADNAQSIGAQSRYRVHPHLLHHRLLHCCHCLAYGHTVAHHPLRGEGDWLYSAIPTRTYMPPEP